MNIFVDGSTVNNGKQDAIGGFSVYIPSLNINLSYSLKSSNTMIVTNQIAELIACIIGIETALKHKESKDKTLYVYTDSKYVINCATVWNMKWIKNGWRTTKNKNIENLWLIYKLINLVNNNLVIFKHINSHQPEPTVSKNTEEYIAWEGNRIVDEYARNATKSVLMAETNIKVMNWNTLIKYLYNEVKDNNNIPIKLKEFYDNKKNEIINI